MKHLTPQQARARRVWMLVLFVLVIVLTALSPLYVVLTVGGGYRDFILYPEMIKLNVALYLILWPVALGFDPKSLAVAAALALCGVIIAVELWRRKRYLEETYQLK